MKAETTLGFDAAELAASHYDQGENARMANLVREPTYSRIYPGRFERR